MEYRRLTGTGIAVSRACLGTMTFGDQVDKQEAIRMVHEAMDSGINFIDTADLYCKGESERITGEALKDRRSNVILATKAFNPCSDDINDRGLSRKHLVDALDNSLRRLQTDYVDIYYLHRPDYNTPMEETMDTMYGFVREGKVRYIGVSNYAAWQISDMIAYADKRNLIPPVVTQNVYNLLTRGIESELLPMTKAHNMGVVVYNPLAAGILTGKHTKAGPMTGTRMARDKNYNNRYWSEENLDAAMEIAVLARKMGIAPAELALRWTVHAPGINAVILGASKMDHFRQNLYALEAPPLEPDIIETCDRVWKALSVDRFAYNR